MKKIEKINNQSKVDQKNASRDMNAIETIARRNWHFKLTKYGNTYCNSTVMCEKFFICLILYECTINGA